MKNRCRNPVTRETHKVHETQEFCEVCGAPYMRMQTIDALIGAPPGSGFGTWLATCFCWECPSCGRQGREDEPRCNCAPCPSCHRLLQHGRVCDCDGLPLPF